MDKFQKAVGNLLFKIGGECKIYQPKAVVFVHYCVLYFDFVTILTMNFSIIM